MHTLPSPWMLLRITWISLAVLNAMVYSAAYSGVLKGVVADVVDLRHLVTAPLPEDGVVDEQVSALREAALKAEADDSAALPGRFVPNQGRQHVRFGQSVPFCDPGVVTNVCYASNPPTSGLHLPVARNIVLDDGNRVSIPPDPGIYDFPIPREAIPHLQEHAGVYLGYACASDACAAAVEDVRRLVLQELSLGARVVMSPDPDLAPDTIAVASWTRVDVVASSSYSDERVRDFIKAHSCRFDPEGFCRRTPVN